MSAWWLFSSMGFYPLQMGDGHYAVGSPLFTKMTVHMDNGKTLTINAPQNSSTNIYVQRLVVNGKDVTVPSIDHADIANGGTIDFVMGPKPGRWGTTGTMPSITTGSKAPQPISDLTGPSQGRRPGCPGPPRLRQHVDDAGVRRQGVVGRVPLRRPEETPCRCTR